jgi:hypothetical protein
MWLYKNGYLFLIDEGELDPGIIDQLIAESKGLA